MKNIFTRPSFTCLFAIAVFFLNIKTGFSQSTNKTDEQDWVKLMQSPHANFYEVLKEFNEWEKNSKDNDKNDKQEEAGELYNNLLNFCKNHLDPDSTLVNEAWVQSHKKSYLSKMGERTDGTSSVADWQQVNFTASGNSYGFTNGRIDCIAISPTDSNTIWAGSPSGGLWKSTDDGKSWTTNTDTLENLGISDIVIDPKNESIMYLAMGDRDGVTLTGNYSIGVLKSIDAGKTWHKTGLVWTISPTSNNTIKRLLISPAHDNILYAATTGNLYKTTDGGATWNSILTPSSPITDMALRPGTPDTLYLTTATGSNVEFMKSINGGTSFTPITLGSSPQNARIAVSPANANYVYVLINYTSNFNDLYLSTDAGTTFNLQSSTINFGNQGWYNLAFAASPFDEKKIFVGLVNAGQSIDAGVTWTNAYTDHTDHHYAIYSPYNPTDIYVGNDGGINKCSYSDLIFNDNSGNMNTLLYYGIGVSSLTTGKVLGATQDNGSLLLESGTLTQVVGGDGAQGSSCFFDYGDDNTWYVNGTAGDYRTTNDGANLTPDLIGNSSIINPVNPNCFYRYSVGLYKTLDMGNTWNIVQPSSNPLSSFSMISHFFSNDSAQLFSLLSDYQIYKINGKNGSAQLLTSQLKSSLISLVNFCVSDVDSNKIWATAGGYYGQTSKRVYYTSDGGQNWKDISGSLPPVPVNTLVYSQGGVYAGTDLGVFYIDNTLPDWINWSQGLPNVIVNDLKIDNKAGKLVAATYGRGLWETDLHSPASGVNELKGGNNQLTLYPNPSSGLFTLKLQNAETNYSIAIYNVLGKLAYESVSSNAQNLINLGSQPDGIYFVCVSTSQGLLKAKILLAR